MKKRVLPTILLLMLLLILFVGCDLKELFEDNNYSITFVLNNGEDNVVWHKGDAVPSPTMDDYIFDGWYCDKLLEKRLVFDFEKDELSSNLVIYAKWKEKQTFEGLSFENLTVVYDGQPHTIVVDNLPEGAKVEYSTPEQFTDAGEYQISVTVSMYGYKDIELSATLVIEKAQILGVKFDDLQVVWDGDSHSVEVQGLPNGVSVEYVNNFQTEVGVYDVVAKFDVGNNYLPLDDMNAKLTILEKMCLLTFADGQGEDRSVSVGYGKRIGDVPPVRDVVGYTAQWNFDINEKIYGDMLIKAVYTPIEYTITFMSMGERWECNQSSFTVEDERFELETPSLRQYVFRGWFDNPLFDGDRIIAIEKGSVGNKTFYAKWEAIEYSIAYDLVYEDATNDVNNPTHFTAESGIVEINAPFMANFEFGGWRIVKTGEIVNSFDAHDFDCDIVLRAEWSKQSFSIQYVLDGGENSEDNPSSYFVGDTDVLQVATKDYYEFVGWFDEMGRKVQTLEGCVGNLTLTARWRAIVYDVNYHNTDGSVLPLSNPTQYTFESEDLNLLPPIRDNYIFEGWYNNADFDNVPITKINSGSHGELNLYAKWRAVEYSITYENTFNANLGNNPTTYTVENCNAVIEPIERAFYVFVGWYDEDGNNVQNLEGHIGNLILTARWNAVVYKVNYNNVSGSVLPLSNPTQYTVESTDLNLSPPFRDNYIFEGWYDNADFDNAPITKISSGSHGDLHLYAKWRAIEYTITYENAFGANLGNNPTTYTVADSTLTLENIQRVGYTFEGWYLNGVKVEIVDLTAGGNITLTARWSAIEYTITYENTFGADLGNNPTKYTVEDSTLTLEDIMRVGYTFDGWYLNGVKVEIVDLTVGGNITLTAKWRAIEYTITYENTFGADLGNNQTTYTVEDGTLTLEDIMRVGYTFDGWYLNGVKVEIVDLTAGGNITLTAKWNAIEYTITYENTFGADLGNNPTKYTVAGGTLTLEDIARVGYTFDGWYLNGVKVEIVDLTAGGNIILTARWSAVEYTITYENTFGADLGNNLTKYTVEDGTLVLEDIARVGYTFDGWYLNGAKVETVDLTIGGNIVFTAKWRAIEYTITYENTFGADLGNNPTAYIVDDGTLALENISRAGYSFDGWFLFGNKVETLDLTNGGNIVLVAKWTAIEFSITYELGEGGVNSVDNPSGYCSADTKIVLKNPSRPHYDFVCWKDSIDESVVEEIDCQIAKDVHLVAVWSVHIYIIEYNLNGGEFEDENVPTSFTYFDDDIVLPNATKHGYKFIGWFENGNFDGEKVDSIVHNSSQNKSLYAKFEAIKYSITLNDGSGRVISFDIESDEIVLPSAVDKTGYKWLYWTDEDGNRIDSIAPTVLKDVVLTPQYEIVKYTITYSVDGIIVSATPNTYDVENVVTLPTLEKDGFVFDGWYDSDDFENTIVNTSGKVGNLTVYAKWVGRVYNVVYNLDGGENDASNPSTFVFGSESIALKTPKKHGYTFVGWTDVDNNTITVINTSIKGDIVLMANWVETEYTVTYNLDGGVCDNRTKFVYSDCPFALNDAQKEGYNFVGWYTLDGENNKTYVESITDVGDIVLYAEYTKIENVLFEYRYVTENESGAEVEPYYAIIKYVGSESEVVIPSTIDGHSISAVESSVFADCIANIEKVVFDEGIKHVQVGIFDGAIKLHTVIFASTLEEMPNGILTNCPKLENLTIPYVGQYKYVKGDRNKTLFCFPNLFEQINAGESKEGYASVVNLRVSTDENGNESVIDTGEYVNVIPLTFKNVTVLDGDVFMRAFAYCTMLKTVKFYGNGTYMGEQALRGCTSLEEVYILADTFNEFGLNILAGSGNLAKVIVQNATQKEKLVAARVSADKIIIES